MNFLWYQVIYGQRLTQSWKIPEKPFAYLSVMTVVDLLQLLHVRGKLIFPQFSDKDTMKHYQACSYDIYLNM